MAEIILAPELLCAAGRLVRSFIAVQSADMGFRTNGAGGGARAGLGGGPGELPAPRRAVAMDAVEALQAE